MNVNKTGLLKKYLVACSLFLLAAAYCGSVFAAGYDTGGKDWKVSISSSYIYDDNVVETPDDPSLRPSSLVGTGDSELHWSASGTYRFKYDDKLDMTADYNIDMAVFFELSAYDLIAHMWGVNPVYRFTDNLNISFRNFIYIIFRNFIYII